MLKAGQIFPEVSMRLALLLIGPVLLGHCETAALLQAEGATALLQNVCSASGPACCHRALHATQSHCIRS